MRSWECAVVKAGNTNKHKKHEKTLNTPKTNTKTKNHFIGLEHETDVKLYLKTQKDTKEMKKHKKHKKPGETHDQHRNLKNIKTKEKKKILTLITSLT